MRKQSKFERSIVQNAPPSFTYFTQKMTSAMLLPHLNTHHTCYAWIQTQKQRSHMHCTHRTLVSYRAKVRIAVTQHPHSTVPVMIENFRESIFETRFGLSVEFGCWYMKKSCRTSACFQSENGATLKAATQKDVILWFDTTTSTAAANDFQSPIFWRNTRFMSRMDAPSRKPHLSAGICRRVATRLNPIRRIALGPGSEYSILSTCAQNWTFDSAKAPQQHQQANTLVGLVVSQGMKIPRSEVTWSGGGGL